MAATPVIAESVPAAGAIVAIRGAVVDVEFAAGPLPPINTALNARTREGQTVLCEVQGHLDARRVRALALRSTIGLRRGDRVEVAGAPVTTPVGDAVLGRLIDAIGETADRGPPLPPCDHAC